MTENADKKPNLNKLPSLPDALSGAVLHEMKIRDLNIQVRDNAHWRWLVFLNQPIQSQDGLTPIQSLYYKPEPSRLIPTYMQVMCAGLALTSVKPNCDKRVLQLGLGLSLIHI